MEDYLGDYNHLVETGCQLFLPSDELTLKILDFQFANEDYLGNAILSKATALGVELPSSAEEFERFAADALENRVQHIPVHKKWCAPIFRGQVMIIARDYLEPGQRHAILIDDKKQFPQRIRRFIGITGQPFTDDIYTQLATEYFKWATEHRKGTDPHVHTEYDVVNDFLIVKCDPRPDYRELLALPGTPVKIPCKP